MIPGKPTPYGVKNFVLCGKSGYPYDFILYQGKSTRELDDFDSFKYGHGAAVVLALSNRLSNPGHKLYCDNYFTNYNLIEIMTLKMINIAGTIRTNRFGKHDFKTDVELKNMGRGSTDQLTSEDGRICLVKWCDNKCVNLASNFCDSEIVTTVKRYDKKKKVTIVINQPEIVANYNNGMGGVDLLDQFISYYRIFIKSRKWTLRIISHFINMAVVCSYIEYKKDCERLNESFKKLIDFQQLLGSELLNMDKKRVGRPNAMNKASQKKPYDVVKPTNEDRFDGYNHLPQYVAPSLQGKRCKLENCVGRSRVICTKCNVHLCFTGTKNCFIKYHEN